MTERKPVREIEIPLRNRTNHPIVIGVSLNERMQAWDLEMLVGNFKTYEDAEAGAKVLKRLAENEVDADMKSVKP